MSFHKTWGGRTSVKKWKTNAALLSHHFLKPFPAAHLFDVFGREAFLFLLIKWEEYTAECFSFEKHGDDFQLTVFYQSEVRL